MHFEGVWNRAKQEDDPDRRKALMLEAAAALARENVVSVVLPALAGGSSREQDAAARVLAIAARRHKAVLESAGVDLCVVALSKAVRRHQITAGIGTNAFEAMRLLDTTAASYVVCRELDISAALVADAGALVAGLRLLRTDDAIRCLRDIVALGGSPGEEAQRALDGLGLAGQDRIEKLASEWREKRTPDLLHRLHLMYTSRLRPGEITAQDVKALLGRPDFEDSGMIAYAPNDGTALTLQKDPEGRIDGVHFA